MNDLKVVPEILRAKKPPGRDLKNTERAFQICTISILRVFL